MTRNELTRKMIESLQSALDNDADNLHDMGWDERLDNLDMPRDGITDGDLDDAYDNACTLLSNAMSEILEGL